MLPVRSQLLFIFVSERPITSNECCRSDGSIVKPSWLAERLHVEMNCRKERHRFALRRHRFALICSLYCSNTEVWSLINCQINCLVTQRPKYFQLQTCIFFISGTQCFWTGNQYISQDESQDSP